MRDMPKVEKMPPTLTLSEEDLPDIKDWKVGDTYEIKLLVEQTSLSKGDTFGPMDGDKQVTARFKVLKAECCDEDMEEEDSEDSSSSKVVDAAKRTYVD